LNGCISAFVLHDILMNRLEMLSVVYIDDIQK